MNDYEKYIIARWCYSIGRPIITDAEYTTLHNYISKLYPEDDYVNRSWSSDPCPKELLLKYNMGEYVYDVVLTDKTESIPSLNSFYEVEQTLEGITFGTLSYKHDGWNYQASYYNGRLILFQSRGRSNDAISAEHLMPMLPQTIPMQGKVTVVMELTVSNEAFEFCKKTFNNVSQRGAVSTLIANTEYSHLLSFHAFDILSEEQIDNIFGTLESWGYPTPRWFQVTSYNDLMEKVKLFSDYCPHYEYPTDGLVYKGDFTRAIRIMRWEEPIYKSYVLTDEECKSRGLETMYKESFGAHRISVGVQIYPIQLQNSTQSIIPMNNLQRIIDYNLQPGAPIAFRFASSAIADLDEDATRYLQREWEGSWEEYRKSIQQNEYLKSMEVVLH